MCESVCDIYPANTGWRWMVPPEHGLLGQGIEDSYVPGQVQQHLTSNASQLSASTSYIVTIRHTDCHLLIFISFIL